jgi:hypothetical protein
MQHARQRWPEARTIGGDHTTLRTRRDQKSPGDLLEAVVVLNHVSQPKLFSCSNQKAARFSLPVGHEAFLTPILPRKPFQPGEA